MTNVQIRILVGQESFKKKAIVNETNIEQSILIQKFTFTPKHSKAKYTCSLGIIPKQALHERRMNYDTISRIINGDFINKVAIFLLFTSRVTFLLTHTFTYVGLSKQKQYWCISFRYRVLFLLLSFFYVCVCVELF